MDTTAWSVLIGVVVAVFILGAVFFVAFDAFRPPPDAIPPTDPSPPDAPPTPRRPIQTIQTRPTRQRAPIQTITPSPGQRAGIQTVVASRIDRPLPAHARCGWCLSLITHCIAEGRGSAVRCGSRGCDGLCCQTCADERHHQCPGICGGTMN